MSALRQNPNESDYSSVFGLEIEFSQAPQGMPVTDVAKILHAITYLGDVAIASTKPSLILDEHPIASFRHPRLSPRVAEGDAMQVTKVQYGSPLLVELWNLYEVSIPLLIAYIQAAGGVVRVLVNVSLAVERHQITQSEKTKRYEVKAEQKTEQVRAKAKQKTKQVEAKVKRKAKQDRHRHEERLLRISLHADGQSVAEQIKETTERELGMGIGLEGGHQDVDERVAGAPGPLLSHATPQEAQIALATVTGDQNK